MKLGSLTRNSVVLHALFNSVQASQVLDHCLRMANVIGRTTHTTTYSTHGVHHAASKLHQHLKLLSLLQLSSSPTCAHD